MESPSVIPRPRRPFLLPLWLTFAAVLAVFIAMVIVFLFYRSAATTVVLLTQHAEKQMSTIEDAPLSMEGEQRAQRLADLLTRGTVAARIDAIYVGADRSTQQTAAPVAERIAKGTVIAPDTRAIIRGIEHDHHGGTVLVVCNGDALPGLVRTLSDIDPEPVRNDEYGTLYVLSVPTIGRANLLRLHY